MTRTKKIAAALAGAALAACAALCLAGCGEDVAASWAHGKVLEADVTAAAESELENYRNDDGSYDISSWTNYIANREYDENATEEEQKANEEAADGTVADYRDYLAKKELREQIVSYEVEKRNIEVTDEEVEEQLDFEAQIYESYYGGGHAGTFESIINNYFGMTLEEYKEGVVAQLKEDKLKQQVVAEKTGSTGDKASADADAAGSDDASADSGDAAEDEVDEDAIFNEYLEELMQSYNATVTACPEGLSYDPQTLAAAQEAGAAEDGDAAAASDEDAATEE